MDRIIEQLRDKLETTTTILGKKDKYLNASVLIPIIKIEDQLHLLYQVRSKHIRQGGEIGFPGGMEEKEDYGDYARTAIRETIEEIGIKESQIEMIGHLGTLVTHSDMTIDIYVAWLNDIDLEALVLSEEVAEVFTVPLKDLKAMTPEIHYVHMEVQPTFVDEKGEEIVLLDAKALGLPPKYNKPWATRKRKIYFYRYLERIIWGMTGEITYEFLKLFE